MIDEKDQTIPYVERPHVLVRIFVFLMIRLEFSTLPHYILHCEYLLREHLEMVSGLWIKVETKLR